MSKNQCKHKYLQSGGGIPRNCIHCDEPEFTLGQKSKMIMTNQSAEEIFNENFKDLFELIEDNDVLQFYKDLIIPCIEGYYTNKLSINIATMNNKIGDLAVGLDLKITECEFHKVKIAQLQVEKERMRKLIDEFAIHKTRECLTIGRCTCGLDKALASL